MDFIKQSIKRNLEALNGISGFVQAGSTEQLTVPLSQIKQSTYIDALPKQRNIENDINSPVPVKITFAKKDEEKPNVSNITVQDVFERYEFESRRYPQINGGEL